MIDAATKGALTELEKIVDDESSHKVSKDQWDALDNRIGAIFPDWYRDIMAKFRIAGTDFEVDTEDCQLYEIRFTSPDMVPGTVDEITQWQWDFEALVNSEYFPLAWGQDGQIFVTDRSGQGPVAQLETTCHDGQTFVAALATSPFWSRISDFTTDLIPAGYEE